MVMLQASMAETSTSSAAETKSRYIAAYMKEVLHCAVLLCYAVLSYAKL